ncbi:MAG: hypothetical protein KBE04_06965 [Phycisphaerae bacterium]|nr:hypothetical protein [Phycisphaerae bacterium]
MNPGLDIHGTEVEKASTTAKSFLAVGPTLHYSHPHVQAFWLATVVVFGLHCLLWSKLTTGTLLSPGVHQVLSVETWNLGRLTTGGMSIFEYPWQIVVLGLLMGGLAVGPILVAQLLSFPHSIPLILAVLLLANLPGLAVSLVISCVGVACRPLRFRSRIIAVVLCMAPQVVYWGLFGAARGMEPVQWGLSFAPWVCAWLIGLALAGAALSVGHFTRYKPGVLVWTLAALFGMTWIVFETTIGLDELAYQLHVVRNDPEQIAEFREHRITEPLDAAITDPATRRDLAGFFYPTEPIPLRQRLKKEIQDHLRVDRWPSWFRVPRELNFQEKRRWLNSQYDRFISPTRPWWMPRVLHKKMLDRRATGPRMAVALYDKAMLSEYSVDVAMLEREEVLRFYHDHPQERSRLIWYQLYVRFSLSPESLEARWRIARHWAGQGHVELAENLAREAGRLLKDRLDQVVLQDKADPMRLFHPPAQSILTENRLRDLQQRLDRLCGLIGAENRRDDPESEARLARFVMLDPHTLEYGAELEALLAAMPVDDPLRDNVLVAQAKALEDVQVCAERLLAIHRQYRDADGGKEALYELARLKIRLYQGQTDAPSKKVLLREARATLTEVITLYPESSLAHQAAQNLATLPTE